MKRKRNLDTKCSTFLSIITTNDNLFALSPDESRDAIASRYNLSPKGFRAYVYNGCSEKFDICSAPNCKKGAFVSACHNALRYLHWDLSSMAGVSQIISKPIVQESNEDLEGLRADWSVRGLWDNQRIAFFYACMLMLTLVLS